MTSASSDNQLLDFSGASLPAGYEIDGRYRIEHVLGEGTFAWVYLARHTTISNLQCAVKVLKPAFVADDELREQFRHEAETIGHLTDKHTVRLSDFGELPDGRPYICMEYCIGATIDKVIQRVGPLDDAIVAHVAIGVLYSLREAHRHGIVHRDIKPANISLTEELGKTAPLTRVLDFGIAWVAQAQNIGTASVDSDLVFCTPSYASPEVLRGKITPTADLYALGLTLAEMIEGEPVYANTGFYTVAARQMSSEPTPFGPRARASVLFPVLQKACAKDEARRYKSAEDMLDAVKKISKDLPESPLLSWDAIKPNQCPGARHCSLASDQLDLPSPAGCAHAGCEASSNHSHLRINRESQDGIPSARLAQSISQTRLVTDDVVDAVLAMDQARIEQFKTGDYPAIGGAAPLRLLDDGRGFVAMIVKDGESDSEGQSSEGALRPLEKGASQGNNNVKVREKDGEPTQAAVTREVLRNALRDQLDPRAVAAIEASKANAAETPPSPLSRQAIANTPERPIAAASLAASSKEAQVTAPIPELHGLNAPKLKPSAGSKGADIAFSSEDSAKIRVSALKEATKNQRRILRVTDYAIGGAIILLIILLIAFGLP